MDDENDDSDRSPFDAYASKYELQALGHWLQNSRTRPALRHSECGDIFRKAPLHRYWEEKFSAKLKQFRQWVARQEES